jgi:chromosome partitioning protein
MGTGYSGIPDNDGILAMQTILVINSKGGCGKTTLATNIASYCASRENNTTIMDYDPQGSSLHWLKLRPDTARPIHAANASSQKGTRMRSLQMYVPQHTKKLIIDAPAGVDGLLLQELVRKADFIIIPVAPSAIDVHATADFVRDLFLKGGVRKQLTQVAVVANRVRRNMPVYAPLERFLHSLNLPFLTRISDSDQYILAAEKGVGIFEMDAAEVAAELREFEPIIDWLNPDAPRPKVRPDNVVNFRCLRI